ncbi:aminotransferase class V-fold PLP-dependent enzyme [Amycolatopsis sp. K13G38]|uniref:Aminotransferase class V-fold PLP-dependent enzyme n=1 Tax=Amycolatopsis acididurans TaxID=2724524 RepID=A0ABX1JC17_9PSEU|nr:aminotransferase class V-fold PLP-dependent enzyme [Amycolatopsis acididurans]NKQ57254.1 aminotransferase class V-fold PLP-dependent enzyme [Amycolatopsis acididurans]
MTTERSWGSGVFEVSGTYLNTPSIGIPPAHAAEAVGRAVERWRTGANGAPEFDEAVHLGRDGFARMVGVPAGTVAIGATASSLIGMVAAGLPDGARVLTAKNDFTSVVFPFAAQAHRGITVTETALADLPAEAPGYDLVAVSVAQSADGALADLDALRAAGVPVLLDATQAAGWLPLRLDWADWVVAAGYKWLLAPRGAAWMAVHPRALERTVPVAANWYGAQDPWEATYGLPLRLADSARRFDLSPVWLAQVGAAAALSYLGELDLEAVHAHCVGLANSLRRGLGLPEANSAIVSFDADVERLAAAGIRAAARAGKARTGFFVYNTASDVERILHALE